MALQRLLITGAAGALGRMARARLAHRIRGFAAQYGESRAGDFVRIEHGLSQQELGLRIKSAVRVEFDKQSHDAGV